MENLFAPPTEEEARLRGIARRHELTKIKYQKYLADNSALSYLAWCRAYRKKPYTIGAAEDLMRAHGLNLEEEIIRLLADQASAVLDTVVSDVASALNNAVEEPPKTATEVQMKTWGISPALKYLNQWCKI